MCHGDCPAASENVHSPSFLPFVTVVPNLSPVVSTGPSTHKSYQARKLEVRLVSGILSILTLASIVATGLSVHLTEIWRDVASSEYLVLLGLFASIGMVLFMVGLPFRFYSGVVLEREYGLMRQSIGGWIKDGAKGMVVGSVIGAAVLVSLYWCVATFGEAWWLPLALVLFLLNLLMAVIGPRMLLPFFYRLMPLEDGELRGRIERLCERAGIRSNGIFMIGLGEKTKKANAALTGIGPSKRILLSDTLLQNLRDDEVEAVFAHEAGHLKLRHIWFGIVSGLLSSFVSLFIVSVAYGWIAAMLGADLTSLWLLPALGVLMSVVSVVLGPLGLWLSRWQEYAADAYAARLIGAGEPLVNALHKLGHINLADPDPHPVLEFLTFSHPSLSRRIARLQSMTA